VVGGFQVVLAARERQQQRDRVLQEACSQLRELLGAAVQPGALLLLGGAGGQSEQAAAQAAAQAAQAAASAAPLAAPPALSAEELEAQEALAAQEAALAALTATPEQTARAAQAQLLQQQAEALRLQEEAAEAEAEAQAAAAAGAEQPVQPPYYVLMEARRKLAWEPLSTCRVRAPRERHAASAELLAAFSFLSR
jgi:hypothetical protein